MWEEKEAQYCKAHNQSAKVADPDQDPLVLNLRKIKSCETF